MKQRRSVLMKVKVISKSNVLPTYETDGSAGMDIRAYIKEAVVLQPGERAMIPTGLFMELTPGYEAQIRARSGLAVKYGIGLVNGIGTIDSDYRGEIQIALINLGSNAFTVENGDRIAQMIIAKYERIIWEESDTLHKTKRADGGFGHTGV